jgi:hypothetical protein
MTNQVVGHLSMAENNGNLLFRQYIVDYRSIRESIEIKIQSQDNPL